MIPKISVVQSADLFTLQATSFGRTEPAGARLFRGGELPAIEFVHADERDALRDAGMLQKYVDLVFGGKRMSKATIRKMARE